VLCALTWVRPAVFHRLCFAYLFSPPDMFELKEFSPGALKKESGQSRPLLILRKSVLLFFYPCLPGSNCAYGSRATGLLVSPFCFVNPLSLPWSSVDGPLLVSFGPPAPGPPRHVCVLWGALSRPRFTTPRESYCLFRRGRSFQRLSGDEGR